MIYIFWPEFWLKPRYVALHVTENGNFFKTLFPIFIRDHIYCVDCTLGYEATMGRKFRIKGGTMF